MHFAASHQTITQSTVAQRIKKSLLLGVTLQITSCFWFVSQLNECGFHHCTEAAFGGRTLQDRTHRNGRLLLCRWRQVAGRHVQLQLTLHRLQLRFQGFQLFLTKRLRWQSKERWASLIAQPTFVAEKQVAVLLVTRNSQAANPQIQSIIWNVLCHGYFTSIVISWLQQKIIKLTALFRIVRKSIFKIPEYVLGYILLLYWQKKCVLYYDVIGSMAEAANFVI